MGSMDSSAKNAKKRKQRFDDEIVWPPTVIIENTRISKTENGLWTGLGNREIALILQEAGHTLGKPKSAWNREGHRGQVAVQYPATMRGLQEADRLHTYFKERGRGREEWERIRSFWHALPGHEGLEEGPEFVRVDKKTNQKQRVLYGYLALHGDAKKVPRKKKQRFCMTMRRSDVEAKATAH